VFSELPDLRRCELRLGVPTRQEGVTTHSRSEAVSAVRYAALPAKAFIGRPKRALWGCISTWRSWTTDAPRWGGGYSGDERAREGRVMARSRLAPTDVAAILAICRQS
jgi:hypothetical protein